MDGDDAISRDVILRLALVAVLAERGYLIRCSCRAGRFVPMSKATTDDVEQFVALHSRCAPAFTVREL